MSLPARSSKPRPGESFEDYMAREREARADWLRARWLAFDSRDKPRTPDIGGTP
jgi:hypothetical protein